MPCLFPMMQIGSKAPFVLHGRFFKPLHVIRGEAERNHDRVNTSDNFRKFVHGVGTCVRCLCQASRRTFFLLHGTGICPEA